MGTNLQLCQNSPCGYTESVSCLRFVDEYGHVSANLEMSVISEIFAIPW